MKMLIKHLEKNVEQVFKKCWTNILKLLNWYLKNFEELFKKNIDHVYENIEQVFVKMLIVFSNTCSNFFKYLFNIF